MQINKETVFGFIRPRIDVHTLGMSTMGNILRDCGLKVVIASDDLMEAVENLSSLNNLGRLIKWIRDNNINILSFSYRLDPKDGYDFFLSLYTHLKDAKLFAKDKGPIQKISFAGLPDTCELIKHSLGDAILYFPGDETPLESLEKYSVPEYLFPKSLTEIHEYDKFLLNFASQYISSESYKTVVPPNHYGYKDCGTDKDNVIKRINYCKNQESLPLIRVHAGPYSPDRLDAIKEFLEWVKILSNSRFLDVLSVGSSQLTQQHFGENWEGLHNGGGVPINSEIEYRQIAQAARPMLVRTYAGTSNVPWMAEMHERTLNISWHALSFWWFCKLDGRGENSVLDNLKEHIETIKYIASTGKPLEPNVPHHFAFRGGDDVSFIVSAFLAAKTAKKYGITHLIVQDMLNTPKYTWGIQDLAKGRALLKLIRTLEDHSFKIYLQTRAGLDYFSPDLEKAKLQLAAVTALMDDIEPDNPNSPEIIHVVSYSEAVRLATPPIILESIKITLGSLKKYRFLKSLKLTYDTVHNTEVEEKFLTLYDEAFKAINLLEKYIPNLYTPEGLYKVYEMGFLPTPYIFDPDRKFPNATKWQTAIINGSVKVIDENGKPIDTVKRYKKILGI